MALHNPVIMCFSFSKVHTHTSHLGKFECKKLEDIHSIYVPFEHLSILWNKLEFQLLVLQRSNYLMYQSLYVDINCIGLFWLDCIGAFEVRYSKGGAY